MDDDDTERKPSKSSRKRSALEAQKLGERLIALTTAELDSLPLTEPLRDAIDLARRISSHGGLARQRQYIGKLMRSLDTTDIETALATQNRVSLDLARQHKQVEAWRDRLLREGETGLQALAAEHPGLALDDLAPLLDRARNAHAAEALRSRASRELFRALRILLEPHATP
ncbi:MAG: DUF615 domain-containing protein [Pseudomonadales bacterium]|nr:DUF615 domain-containing protein [Pseudomonadales bacterium]